MTYQIFREEDEEQYKAWEKQEYLKALADRNHPKHAEAMAIREKKNNGTWHNTDETNMKLNYTHLSRALSDNPFQD